MGYFCFELPTLDIWLSFFFLVGKKKWIKEKTCTHYRFQPQHLCLQHCVALSNSPFDCVIYISVNIDSFGDSMVVEREWESLGDLRPRASFLCLAYCKELILFL